jgi:hypothetical protein
MRQVRRTAAVLFFCLAVAPAAHAARVKSGAMDICRIIDGGQVTTVEGTEVCCAKEVRGDEETGQGTGAFYCVQCDPPGSDNCESFTAAGARPGLLNTMLLRVLHAQNQSILVGGEQIRTGLGEVLAALGVLQTRLDAVEAACSRQAPSAVEEPAGGQ